MTTKYTIKNGELFASREGTSRLLGARIQVLRKIRRTGYRPAVELRLTTLTGPAVLEVSIGTTQACGSLIRALAEAGYKVPANRQDQRDLCQFISTKMEDAPAVTVPTTNGWYRDEARASNKWAFSLHTTNDAPTAGTVASYAREVGALLPGNPFLIFLTSAALAGPLVELRADISPIFAVIGDSGSGKSTATNLARSVYFPHSMRGTWDGTVAGLLAFTQQFAGAVAEIDELGAGDNVVTTIYRLCNGNAPRRANADGSARESAPFRTVLLASGEHSLFEAAHMEGRRYSEGFDARFIALPVGREFPMFQCLYGIPSPALFAEKLTAATRRNYGALGRAWIDFLVERRNAGHDLGRGRFERICAEMRAANDIENRPRQWARVVAHFALAASAGEMAAAAGLLPLKRGECADAAWYALRAWAAGKTDLELEPQARMLRDVRRWLETLESEKRVAPFSREAFDSAETLAFRYRRKGAGAVVLVRPEAMYQRFGSQLTYYVRALKERGYLATGPRNEPRKQFGVPNDPARRVPGFYAILPAIFQRC